MSQASRDQPDLQEKTRTGSRMDASSRPTSGSAKPGIPHESAETPMTKLEQPADAEAQVVQEQEIQQENYSSFPSWKKKSIVLGAAAAAFFSPLSGQIYYPALNVIANDLGETPSRINLTVTTYMIFQGVTPMFVGSFADATGRRPAYLFCFVVYIAANIGCALAPNYAALLVLRMLQSAGASTTVALCQAVVADIITSAERGQYVGWTALPIILAPSLGPVLGGIFSQYLGWRWIFWFLTILSGFCFVLYAFFMPETCRNIVGDGSIRPHPYYRTFYELIKDALRKRRTARDADNLALQPTPSRVSTKQSFHLKRPNPIRSLLILFEKEMLLLLLYSSLIYGGFYAIATAMPVQLAGLYGFEDVTVGLMYLPMGGGSIVAAFAMGKLTNWNYRRHCKILNVPVDKKRQQDLDSFPIEKARLEVGAPLLGLFTLVLIGWGWAFEYRAHLAVPIILLFLMGISVIGFSNTVSTLIVDINPGQAGSATAANNLTRCLVGAAASAVIVPMLTSIGSGWSYTIFSLIYVAFYPAMWLVMRNGVKWRKARAAKERQREARKEENGSATAGQETDVAA